MKGKTNVHMEGKTTINAKVGIIKSKSTDQTRFSIQLHED
jgi:hypothetical protein